jgi:hypothetical protein
LPLGFGKYRARVFTSFHQQASFLPVSREDLQHRLNFLLCFQPSPLLASAHGLATDSPVFLPSLSCPVQALGLSAVRALLPGRYFDFICCLFVGLL